MANASDTGDFHVSGGADPAAFGPEQAGVMLERLRKRRPRVHCLTNDAARASTANILLAIGCEPSLSADPTEVRGFVTSADALLANLGTMNRDMKAAIDISITAAKDGRKPWVLDPVLCDRSDKRAEYSLTCLARKPRAVRLNPAEAKALGGDALQAAVQADAVVAMSGQTDHVYARGRQKAFRSGHPLMARVTGMGCGLGAVMAGFLAVSDDDFGAVAAASMVFSAAGALAGNRAAGPGSFVPAFLDALCAIEASDLQEQHGK